MRLPPRFGVRTFSEGVRREVIKGAAEQVIRVRAPVAGIFREAVFFMQEDYLQNNDARREELLREARRAAESYVNQRMPEPPRTDWWPYLLALLVGMGLGVCLAMFLRL